MTIHDVEALLPNVVQIGWLVLLGAVLWRFGQPLGEALGRLRRGKVAGIEIELDVVNKELAKLDAYQPFPFTQVVSALPEPSSSSHTEDTANTDAFGGFVAALLELASRAPEAALIRLRVELERSMGNFDSLLHSPGVMDPIARLPKDLAPEHQIDQFHTIYAAAKKNVERYMELHRRILSLPLPTSDERVRSEMFALIDTGISLLNPVEQTCSRLISLSDLAHRRPSD